MSIFNKNKKKSNTEQVTQSTEAPVKATKKKKKKDGMASILHESVLETALDEFSNNTAFIVKHDGEDTPVGLWLDTNDIGGISKKDNKNEDKGSMIECINSGRIKTLITMELMEQECLVFIPDAITIDAMYEFGLLEDVSYRLCYVATDGSIELTDVSVRLDDIKSIMENDENITKLLGNEEEEEVMDDMNDEETEEEIDISESVDDEDISEMDESGFNEETDMSEPDDIDVNDLFTDNSDSSDVSLEPEYESEEELNKESKEEVQEESVLPNEIPDAMVKEAIIRKFYSDDLGLEVSTEPFDSQFLHTNDYIPFDENRGEGWLNEYLNQMSKEANTEMRRLHQDNLFKMRERYFKLISEHCEQIYKDLDIMNGNNNYGKIYTQLLQYKVDEGNKLESRTQERKNELNQAWEQKLNQEAEEGARAAKKQYYDRYHRQHEEELYNVQLNLADEIEANFQQEVRAMHDERRREAAKRLDYGINETLAEISTMYSKVLKSEHAHYQKLRDNMAAFLDNHRKDEVARTEALAEELRQSQKADAIMTEYAEKMKEMSAEFDAKRVALQSDIEVMERNTAQKIKEKEEEHDNRMAEMQRRNDDLQGQVDKLLQQFATLDEIKNKEYASRINELVNERSAWEDKCNHVIDIHKRSNLISGFLVGVAIVAALAIGYIAGEFSKINDSKKEAQSAIINEFYDEMNHINNSRTTESDE